MGSSVALDGTQKKSVPRLNLTRCTVIGGGVNELRPELFTERLGIKACHVPDTATHARDVAGRENPEGGLHVVVAGSQNALHAIVEATLGGPVTTGSSPATSKTTFIMNWHRPLHQMRSVGGEAETMLNLSMRTAGFDPGGLLGWGFTSLTDPFDGNGDPVRMLTHLSRSLRHLSAQPAHMERAKAAMACVAHGGNARSIRVATDGVALLVEVVFEAAPALRSTAGHLAGWMDQVASTTNDTCMAWVRKVSGAQVAAGLVIGTGHIPLVLVVDENGRAKARNDENDENDETSDHSIEPRGQTGYNVA
ncbi:hypothetical protein EBZ80_16250 [bacterium]|nr:hypothetical protein [bacterium]